MDHDIADNEVTYNFYICKYCECIYNNQDAIDCDKCGNSMCIFLFQAKNKTSAIKCKREKYGQQSRI